MNERLADYLAVLMVAFIVFVVVTRITSGVVSCTGTFGEWAC